MRKGFTLIELLITISIIAVLGVVATLNLANTRNTAVLKSTSQDIGAILQEAQSDSVTESKGAQWGVHLDNTSASAPFYSLFYTTSTYASATIAGQYPLPGGICYATSSVASGSSSTIIFSNVSGIPSASATITLQLMAGGICYTSSTTGSPGGIARTGSGEIFFDNFSRSSL